VIVTFPYVMRTVSVALARYDRGLDEAAAGLGARPAQVFWRVTLPIIRPGVFAGALFAFIESFDNFTVTIFLIGADTLTLPVAIYQYMEWNLDPTVSAISALLIALAVGLTLVIERTMGLDRFIGIRG
jgi:putative spermidine/putrescine transport system permease protein